MLPAPLHCKKRAVKYSFPGPEGRGWEGQRGRWGGGGDDDDVQEGDAGAAGSEDVQGEAGVGEGACRLEIKG